MGVGLCWCAFLTLHVDTFTVCGKSKSAETHSIQSKYFHTSSVFHKLLSYQSSNISSCTLMCIARMFKELIILQHLIIPSGLRDQIPGLGNTKS